ncbi:uncharacterized protein GGS25DRAFT_87496 [Hypoxylon fragiforme]|uniref:uncharacterized protein n=1 Tax=Hypoxylon fragiforme TaxID=63214 RepID=UPI0020C6A713|nr:uncharacterized protein GGS25DRAFT_87496 [Hypoxylon fragiforme]KAI2603293.1 hypothetical protein GGS25DRAFT_87496 [Hypoxylon fragiforme]
MGAQPEPTTASSSASSTENTWSTGMVVRKDPYANNKLLPYPSSMEACVIGRLSSNNFQFEDLPLVYPLGRRDSVWTECSNGTLPLGPGGVLGSGDGGDKLAEFEGTGLFHGALPLSAPDNPSSLTYSPASSYQGSVWSPVQTDFTPEISCARLSRSRVPSPLRNGTGVWANADYDFTCAGNQRVSELPCDIQLELQSGIGRTHVCLWGNNGPCSSAGFATREELNWHVKSEHLLLCPILSCTESAFTSKALVDCHLKYAHGYVKVDKSNTLKPSNLLKPVVESLGTSDMGGQKGALTKKPEPAEDKILKLEMSIGISKKRCRDQLRTVLEKRIKKANGQILGGTPKSGESPGTIQYRTPRLLESASFPIVWEHGVLPFLVEFIPKWCGAGHVISVMRGRLPNSRRISIMTKRPVSRARRLVIAGHVRDLLPETYRKLITFVFSTGKVDRLVWARGLSKNMPDEVCLPRNPFCYTSPCMGDSIGTTLEDGDEITATLGPCITVGGGSYWLVNFHPFVEASRETPPVSVEHPSPVDRAKCLEERHDMLSSGDLDFQLGNLTATSGFDLKTTRISHDPYWEECDKEPPLVVMDWGLVSAKTRQANMLRKFPTTNHRRDTPVISMSSIVPGAIVCSTGRTSGFQRGQVCEVPAYLDGSESGTGKASREWYIEEPEPYDNEEGWISGGIGVEGDSGGAIIELESNALIGQLWGRNKYYGPGPRHTFFTPIFDIFDDIQEKCSQDRRPQLPQHRDEADRFPVYPICRQCFDLREYLESRRSSRESLVSMIGMHDGRAGDTDNDLTSVSELATPKEQSALVRHVGSGENSSFGVVSPAPVHTFYTVSQAMSPGNTELRSPYAQALNDEDLYDYERCPDTSEVSLGKRPALPTPMERSGSQHAIKRRRVL